MSDLSADELDTLLERARSVSEEEAPRFLGYLEIAKAVTLQRLNAPAPAGPQREELLDVKEAALRLKMSKKYLYTHRDRFSFTRRVGTSLRFSANGIDAYIRRNGAIDVLTPRSIRPIVPPETLHNISDRKEKNFNDGEERRQ